MHCYCEAITSEPAIIIDIRQVPALNEYDAAINDKT